MENDDEAGISHLIEHMMFKGTSKRTAKQIAEAIEGRGGHLNAFTDREVTCYYARVLKDDVDNCIEVLCDMLTNSLFADNDLALEKRVVQEEIKKYNDSPEDQIHDLHAQHRWGEHPLGKPIIGTHESVGSFQADNIRTYMKRRYVANRVVVSVAGNVDPSAVVSCARQQLGGINGTVELPSSTPPSAKPGEKRITKDIEQVHFCIGADVVNALSEDRFTCVVLDAVLGGSMSSRLFQEIREKRGLAYAIGSYLSLYREAGAYTIYGGTNPEQYEQVCELSRKELAKIASEGVPEEELDRTKKMISGEMVLGLEGMSARMTRMARSELVYGRDVPIEEVLERVNKVTPHDLQTIASQYLAADRLVTTAVGPF